MRELTREPRIERRPREVARFAERGNVGNERRETPRMQIAGRLPHRLRLVSGLRWHLARARAIDRCAGIRYGRARASRRILPPSPPLPPPP